MNWDAVGAIGEIIGAIAVIASLAYFAIQLKRGSIATQHASQNAFIADYNRLLEQLYANGELVDLLQRSMRGPEMLTENERDRFHAFFMAQHIATFNMYLQLQANQFDRRVAEPLIRFFAILLKLPTARAWWDVQKLDWDPTYVAYIESLSRDSASRAPEPWWTRSAEGPRSAA